MIESKSLTEWTPGSLRGLLDLLHGKRERYDRANRLVEVRSCDLEIAEATRALAILNRRATEALDPAPGTSPIADELAQWMSASDGKLELTTAEIRAAGMEILENRRRATEVEDQRVAEERPAIRKAVLEVCEDKLDRIGFHSGGSFGVEYDSDDKAKLLGEIADAIAVSIGIQPRAQREADLREADLREAFVAGCRRVMGNIVAGQGPGFSWARPEPVDIDQWSAEYARSKAGG